MADIESTAALQDDPSPISLVIADDEDLTLAGMAALCRRVPGVTLLGLAHTGAAGLALIRERTPILALLDLSLHDQDGVTIATCLRGEAVPTRVILIADRREPRWFRMALSVPVPGYLLRSSDEADLSLAIRTVAAGGVYYAAAMQEHLTHAEDAFHVPQLGGRERQILRLMVKGQSSKEIARQLGMETRQVDRIRLKLMKKFGVHSATELVAYVLQHDVLLMGSGGAAEVSEATPSAAEAKAKGRAQTGG